ncbi:DUF3012 domain-containing protein [Vibrio cholerae]
MRIIDEKHSAGDHECAYAFVGSKAWCEDMREKPKSEWNTQDTLDFAKHCIFNNEVGSKSWCEDMDEKSKGDWTAKEAGSYAKYCVL